MTATILRFPSPDELAARLIDDVLAKGLAIAPGRFRDDLRSEIVRLVKPLSFETFAAKAPKPSWFAQLGAEQEEQLRAFLQAAANEVRDAVLDGARRAVYQSRMDDRGRSTAGSRSWIADSGSPGRNFLMARNDQLRG